MIKLKVANLREKIGKNLSEIARETGLNRNTINAIFSEKVDGIKFDTLEKLCGVYGLEIVDVLEFEPESQLSVDWDFPYKQEGELVPFTAWPPAIALNKMDKKYFAFGAGDLDLYFKNGYGEMYWRKEPMIKLAKWFYGRYANNRKLDELYKDYLSSSQDIEALYRNTEYTDVLGFSKNEISVFCNRLWKYYEKFWGYCLFIDAFDPGYDQEKIQEISRHHHLDLQEVVVLSTPAELTFNNEKQYQLLVLVSKLINKNIPKNKLKQFLKNHLKDNEEIKKYIKDFDYYKSNYGTIRHVSLQEVEEDFIKYLSDKKLFRQEFEALKNYSKNHLEKTKKILKSHKLNSNPLEFFARLTYWREHRKMINLMGIQLLDAVLDSLEQKTGISKKYLKYLTPDEISMVMSGLLTQDVLQRRLEDGMIFVLRGIDYKVLEGTEAKSLREELEDRLSRGRPQDVVAGQVASQGYARGIARVVLDLRDFGKFKEGEILVTGMTRPEFVPLMKLAAGIVTNEGGITCHAAIVSRELNKPCIIGTQNATKLIHDGDLVEVRANHGTVRILERAK